MRISLAVVLLWACASACAPRDAQPESPAEPATISTAAGNEELDLDAAALRFERAEQDIGELLPRADASKGDGEAPSGDDAQPAGPPPVEADRPAGNPSPETNQPGPAPPMDQPRATGLASSRAQRCTRACDALQIMKRSAARLCDLTGSDDPRCSDVTERYERADERVRKACPECS